MMGISCASSGSSLVSPAMNNQMFLKYVQSAQKINIMNSNSSNNSSNTIDTIHSTEAQSAIVRSNTTIKPESNKNKTTRTEKPSTANMKSKDTRSTHSKKRKSRSSQTNPDSHRKTKVVKPEASNDQVTTMQTDTDSTMSNNSTISEHQTENKEDNGAAKTELKHKMEYSNSDLIPGEKTRIPLQQPEDTSNSKQQHHPLLVRKTTSTKEAEAAAEKTKKTECNKSCSNEPSSKNEKLQVVELKLTAPNHSDSRSYNSINWEVLDLSAPCLKSLSSAFSSSNGENSQSWSFSEEENETFDQASKQEDDSASFRHRKQQMDRLIKDLMGETQIDVQNQPFDDMKLHWIRLQSRTAGLVKGKLKEMKQNNCLNDGNIRSMFREATTAYMRGIDQMLSQWQKLIYDQNHYIHLHEQYIQWLCVVAQSGHIGINSQLRPKSKLEMLLTEFKYNKFQLTIMEQIILCQLEYLRHRHLSEFKQLQSQINNINNNNVNNSNSNSSTNGTGGESARLLRHCQQNAKLLAKRHLKLNNSEEKSLARSVQSWWNAEVVDAKTA